MKILVVDDSAIQRKMMVRVLNMNGFDHVIEAADGMAAVKILDEETSLLITDWQMPKMDGLHLVQFVRNIPNFSHMPILMATTEGEREEVLSALNAGVNDYLIKPFTQESFLTKVKMLLEVSGA